ncbi:E2-like conjugating enzyme atg10 [Coemansia nantahalensis]|nr:E2-like conjugating enzyme atg10 [Coemansia nantahalensis]
MDGSLSEFPFLTVDEFAACAGHFVSRYGAVLDTAYVAPAAPLPRRQPYLRIRCALLGGPSSSLENDCEDPAGGWDAQCLEDADPALDAEPPASVRRAEIGEVDYHIVYSPTWRVPVVYLRVQDARSAPETVMDVGRAAGMLAVDRAVRGAMADVEFGGALGIQDHPVLGVPFLYLHPCHTATLLRAVVAPPADGHASGVSIGTANYMAALLSLVGPAVGLALPAV